MTLAAGNRDVGVIDGRVRVAGGQYLVSSAMAGLAARGGRSSLLVCFGVVTVCESLLRIGVALRAGDLFWRDVVRR